MGVGSPDGGDSAECNGVGLVEISEKLQFKTVFSDGMVPFDRQIGDIICLITDNVY